MSCSKAPGSLWRLLSMRRMWPLALLANMILNCSALAAQGLAGERVAQKGSANESIEFFLKLKEEEGLSHASGARPELGPSLLRIHQRAVRLMRIGLNPTRFAASGGVSFEFDATTNQNHSHIAITATGEFSLKDVSMNFLIAVGQAGDEFAFASDDSGIAVTGPNGALLGIYPGPISAMPASTGSFLRVNSIRRRNLNVAGSPFEPPLYRGTLEVIRSQPADQMRLVNVVDLEEYLQGVVTNESPASFHVEALKAQAIAARSYAVANIGRFASRGFDLDDSTLSQVYRGLNSEHPRAIEAVSGTRGLVLSFRGRPIPTLYSSSMGGHTESNEWIFNSPSSELPGNNAHPALRAVHDANFPVPVDLSSDEGALAFYSLTWDHFDSPQLSGNSRYRWKENRSVEFIAERLRTVLGASVGNVKDIVVKMRSPSGRIARLQIVGENGSAQLQGWQRLRDFFQLLNSPSAIVPVKDQDGTVRSFDIYGGGWGHNVGMSQFGANGRGRSGQTFAEILKAYYTGADIGTQPIVVDGFSLRPAAAVPQEFVSHGKGTLIIDNIDLAGILVSLNNGRGLFYVSLAPGMTTRADISQFLSRGLNTVELMPVGFGRAVALVAVD